MPSAYCPCCGAIYDSPTISPNGPVCRYCLRRGQIVVLLSMQPSGRPARAPPRVQPPSRRARSRGC